MNYCIYKLTDASDRLFYIGITINPKARLKYHRIKFGYKINMETIETIDCTHDAAAVMEQQYIDKYRGLGYILLNSHSRMLKGKSPMSAKDKELSAKELQTIKIKESTLPKLRRFVKDMGYVQYEFITKAIEEKIERETIKKSQKS